MTKALSLKLITLLVLLALSLLAIPGCNTKEASPVVTTTATTASTKTTASAAAPSQQELQQVLANSVAAMKKAGSYRLVMNMGIKMDISGGSSAGNMEMASVIGGDVNQTARQMFIAMDIAVKMNAKTGAPVSQNMSIQMYVLADTAYYYTEIPPIGKQWIKMPVSDDLMKAYGVNSVDQQLALLDSVKDLKFLRYETFDGSDCYVLTMTPDMQKVLSWVSNDLPAGLNTGNLGQISKMFKNLSYTMWIARDSGLIKNMDVSMLLEMSPDQFASGQGTDFQSMTMNVAMTMKLFDFNKPISVVLPPEARNAMEIPAPALK